MYTKFDLNILEIRFEGPTYGEDNERFRYPVEARNTKCEDNTNLMSCRSQICEL